MTDRLDVLRSFVRAGADRAGRRLRRVLPIGALQRMWADLRHGRAVVRRDALTSAVAHAPDVEAASVATQDGGLRIDASFPDGAQFQFVLRPAGVQFAPRGAKEIGFGIEPADLAGHPRVTGIVASIAGAVARGLWTPLLTDGEADFYDAIVEREGGGRVRVDLRSVPAVRQAMRRGPWAMIFEVLELRDVRVTEDGLVLELRLPDLHL